MSPKVFGSPKKSMVLLTAIAITLLVSVVCAAEPRTVQPQTTLPQTIMTRHLRDAVVDGRAKFLGAAPASQTLRLDLVLPLRNESELDTLLQALYDPANSSYRHFLTVDEFTARFGPSQQDFDAVIAFAKANGLEVVSTSRNRMNIGVTGSVATVEKAFHLTMGLYQHPTENRTFFAPDREPTADLPFSLWHISGLDNYSIPRPLFKSSSIQAHPSATTGSGPDASFLGSDMRAAYYGGSSLNGSGQSLGLLEYAGTDLADLNTYYQTVGQTLNVPITLVSTDGTPTSCTAADSCDDTEQTIDMTQALGMAPNLSSLVMYVGSSDTALLSAMAAAKPLNYELSSSWLWGPSDPSTDDPYFKEFATQGQSYFQAAGDWNEWSQTLEGEGAVYPSDDVYVISVGGTDLETASAGGPWSSETAWSDSGGGISPEQYTIPSWQEATAAGCSECSTSYRNGPDVAAEANFDYYVCADQTTCSANYYGGTSFAAPMWAAYIALVNQQALANGGSHVGFINPAIYNIGLSSNYNSDFHDVVSGNNGYSATTGYDLVTGWGSPNGTNLINALAGGQSGSAAVTFSASSFAFGNVVVGASSGTKVLTLTSSGSTTLDITSISASANFNVSSTTCGSQLAVNGKCKVSLTFTPGSTGPLAGTLTIVDNASNGQQTVSLTGTGIAQATLTPASATYASRKVNTTSAAKIFTLANKQKVNLTGIIISTTGNFAVSATTCTATLSALSKCTVNVTFTPTQSGTNSGQLTVSDSASNSPQTSSLSGTGH
jgi:subtilase family serine protease